MTARKISATDFLHDPELSRRAARSREVARALDGRTQSLPHAITLTHHEFTEFIAEMTPKRLELLRHAVGHSLSISELAQAVDRAQSAVSKDVARLTKLGLVRLEEVPNAGHGRKKIVVPVAESISISARFAPA